MKWVLNLLLKQVRLTYEIKGDAVQITTARSGGRLLTVRYRVKDLITDLRSAQAKKRCSKEETPKDRLIQLITSTVEPDSWSAMGGVAKIRYCSRRSELVISQGNEEHEQIDGLLSTLRRLRDLAPADTVTDPNR